MALKIENQLVLTFVEATRKPGGATVAAKPFHPSLHPLLHFMADSFWLLCLHFLAKATYHFKLILTHYVMLTQPTLTISPGQVAGPLTK